MQRRVALLIMLPCVTDFQIMCYWLRYQFKKKAENHLPALLIISRISEHNSM